jgi:hypothetical protein
LMGVFGEFSGTYEIWGENAPLQLTEVATDQAAPTYTTA